MSLKHIPRADFDSVKPLPITPEEITPEWLSNVLGFNVKSVDIIQTIHATASKVIIGLTYDEASEIPGNAPKTLCVKGGFNPQLMALHPAVKGVYRREAEFYYHVAPHVNLRLPLVWYCGTDTVNGQGIVIMADLSNDGTVFGSASDPWPVERVRSGVEQLAILHGSTWNPDESHYPWLTGTDDLEKNPVHSMVLTLATPEAWKIRFAEDVRPPVTEKLNDRGRAVSAFKTLWRATDTKYRSLIHGDAHVANTYITPAGDPVFMDWQGLHFGSPFHDLPYFMIGSMTIEDRRATEKDLVAHYLQTLHNSGGPRLALEDIWDEYRKHVFHGFCWAIVGIGLQPEEYIRIMTERFCAAIDDHGTLELLESLPEYQKE